MVKGSTASRLKQLARQLYYLQDRQRAYSKMCCADPETLNISIKIIKSYTFESAVVNLTAGPQAAARKLATRVYLQALAESAHFEENEVIHEMKALIKSKFAEKETQDRVFLHYTEHFQKNNLPAQKGVQGLKTS